MIIFIAEPCRELYDFQTGRLLPSTRVPAADLVELMVVGPVVFLVHPQAPNEFTAYDVDTLTRLWTPDVNETTWRVECGRRVCVAGAGPFRGAPTHHRRDRVVRRLVAGGQFQRLVRNHRSRYRNAGRYLQLTDIFVDGQIRGSWLIDAGTGEPVLDLGRWLLESPAPSPAPERPMAVRALGPRR